MLQAAATVTSVDVHGGELEIAGYDYLITALNVHGGEVNDYHVNTGADEWTTVNVYGGLLKLPLVADRDYTTLNLYGGRVEGDWSGLTGTEAVPVLTGQADRRAVEVTAL